MKIGKETQNRNKLQFMTYYNILISLTCDKMSSADNYLY